MEGTGRIRLLSHRGWHVCLILATALLVTPARATVGDIGYLDQSFSGASTAPSGSKPESKLWWNDGFWWGSLYDTLSGDFHIFKLNIGSQTWADTGVALDDRPTSRADALWDGTHLYVASHVFTTSPASGSPSRLYRFSYDPATDIYSRDSGFPVAINDFSTETLVIAKDSTGKLWATWTQGSQVYVNRTTGNDLLWGTPFVLPVSGVNVNADDISSVVSFGGNQIGVMWSNQNASAMYFAAHLDGQPDGTWQASRTALQGPATADDHINLKSLQSDGSGRVFAAVKTSMTTSSAPLIMLLVRDLATGNWTSSVFGRVSDDHTRPIVLLDEEHSIIHMFATAPETGGTIYEKTSPTSAISFPLGLGTPVLRDAASAAMNNVTSTKQNVNSTTGLVILATNDTTHRYWHAYQSLGGSVPSPEVCDGIDNNGNGLVDEGFDVGAPCTTGQGACQVSGTKVCSADHTTTVCNATPPTEICDGIDNDCDGLVDEGFDVGASCTAGLGACQASGTKVCSADHTTTVCNATPGTPTTEICDGIDNDCDGIVDDGFGVGTRCTVGVGACQASGTIVCSADHTSSFCTATPGTPSPEICDGIDNDCDGVIDNGFDVGASCSIGTGTCQSFGKKVCSADHTTTVCNAKPKHRKGC